MITLGALFISAKYGIELELFYIGTFFIDMALIYLIARGIAC